jgi:hypothetical protein
MVVFRNEGTTESTTEILSRESRSSEFTLLNNVFWYYVTEDVYIRPFDILLMERHTEIEHVFRHVLFWNCTQHKVVIPFWCFGVTSQSHFQGSRCSRRTCLDSRQPAHTVCLLEELIVANYQSINLFHPFDNSVYTIHPLFLVLSFYNSDYLVLFIYNIKIYIASAIRRDMA